MAKHDVAHRPDQELARAVLQQGDEAAFRELYHRHTPRLYQFALRILAGDEQDAEDVVQDTWIRATENLGRFRWEARLDTWLTGIALNGCRAALRAGGRWKNAEWADDLGISMPTGTHEERIDLERAIALLPAGYRAVIVLHDIEGFTHAEIGELLGISAGTSKSQLFFARRAMRSVLDPARAAPGG